MLSFTMIISNIFILILKKTYRYLTEHTNYNVLIYLYIIMKLLKEILLILENHLKIKIL